MQQQTLRLQRFCVPSRCIQPTLSHIRVRVTRQPIIQLKRYLCCIDPVRMPRVYAKTRSHPLRNSNFLPICPRDSAKKAPMGAGNVGVVVLHDNNPCDAKL